MPFRILIFLLCLSTGPLLEAQEVNQLLGRLGRTPPGEERVTLLLRIAKAEAVAGHWDEVEDFARLCQEEALGLDLPGPASYAYALLARAQRMSGHITNALDLAVRSSVSAQEAGVEEQDLASLELAEIHVSLGVYRRAMEHLSHIAAPGELGKADRMRFELIMATCQAAMDDIDGALGHYRRALLSATEAKDREVITASLDAMAALEVQRGNYIEAARLEEDLLQVQRVSGSMTEQGQVLNNLGELNDRLGKYELAADHYVNAAALLFGEPLLHEKVLLNLANSYIKQGHGAKANRVLDNVFSIMDKRRDQTHAARAHAMRAALLLEGNDPAAARDQAVASDRAAARSKDIKGRVEAYELLVHIAAARGWNKEARAFQDTLSALRIDNERALRKRDRERDHYNGRVLKQEQDIMNLVGMEQRDRLRMQQTMLDAMNQGKELEIFRYRNELQEAEIRETAMAREKAQQQLALSQAALEAERRSRTIDQLEGQKTVQMLAVTKLELEKKQKESAMTLLKRQNELLESDRKLKEEAQRRDRLISRFAIIAGSILAVLCGFAFWVMRKVRAKNRIIRGHVNEIGSMNRQLQDSNENMLSSIRYARKIQNAIIPSEAHFRELLPDSFLFYRPRDVVSGDLPYLHQVNGRVHVAAIDCTGHGVPAAMLSFMAYYNLTDIINKMPQATPDAILLELHARVSATISQGAETSMMSDGMEIGLVTIEPDGRTINFAGAGISMMFERNGEVQRIKGDRRSIGDRLGDGSTGFHRHNLQLTPEDHVYLFSDGLVHQFGGVAGKQKLSYRRVSQHIAGLSGVPGPQAGILTDELFSDWKGAEEQTDDVLMIGFSVPGTKKAKAA